MTRKNPHAAALGKRGGAARTPAKAAASRANGAKGGRPRAVEAVPDVFDSAVRLIQVWRPAGARAKHPLCVVRRFTLAAGDDGWIFQRGIPTAPGRRWMGSLDVEALLARHAAKGNRFTVSAEATS